MFPHETVGTFHVPVTLVNETGTLALLLPVRT
jgi:hypothetical protein